MIDQPWADADTDRDIAEHDGDRDARAADIRELIADFLFIVGIIAAGYVTLWAHWAIQVLR